MRHDGVPNVCSEAGIGVQVYQESQAIAIIDSDGVELRRYSLDQQQEALQYALEAVCDRLDLNPEEYGFEFV